MFARTRARKTDEAGGETEHDDADREVENPPRRRAGKARGTWRAP
jgi:hypothetical protein